MPRFIDQNPNIRAAGQRHTEIESMFLQGWKGGWQPDLEEASVQPDALPELLNMDWTKSYGLKKRSGFTKQTADAPAQLTLGQYLWGLKTWKVVGSATLVDPAQLMVYATESDASILYQTSAKLLDASPTNFLDAGVDMGAVLGTASNRNPVDEWQMQAFVFNDIAYITGHRFGGSDAGVFTLSTEDGTSTGPTIPLQFTIQTEAWARAGVPNLTTAGTQTGIPRAVSVEVAHDRVFYANVASQNVYDYGSRVYFSDAGTANKISGGAAGSWLTIGADDGTTIRGMKLFGGEIIVFKEESVWTLSGTDEDTFSVNLLSDEYGCHAQHTIGVHNDVLYFMDPYAGVISYNGARFEVVSRDINDRLFAALNRSAGFKSQGFIDSAEEKYYLSVPVGGVTALPTDRPTTTYVYDIRLKVWTEYDYGFSSIVKVDATVSVSDPVAGGGPLWVVAPDSTLGVFEINSGLTDNGTQFTSTMRTAFLNPDDVDDAHRLRGLSVLASTTSPAGSVTSSFYRDFNTTNAMYTTAYTVTAAGNQSWQHQDQEQKSDVPNSLPALQSVMWTWLSVKLSQASSTDVMEVMGIGLNYSSRPKRRSKRGSLNKATE